MRNLELTDLSTQHFISNDQTRRRVYRSLAAFFGHACDS
jgi:hypothetical protein